MKKPSLHSACALVMLSTTPTSYVAIAAERIWAMLMTPTCDLDDLVVWSVWPLYQAGANECNEDFSPTDLVEILATSLASLTWLGPDRKDFSPEPVVLPGVLGARGQTKCEHQYFSLPRFRAR